jgi:iron complex transport system permease protein
VSAYATTLPASVAGRIHHRRRRESRRGLIVTGLLGGLAFALFVLTLAIGSSGLAPTDVLASLFGLSNDGGVDFIVHELRLPIAGAALCVGLALGVSGTLFQQLLSNPLATPDFIGISAGASLAAVAGIVLFDWTGYGISAAALLGAVGGAGLIYALAWRGGITGYRMILVGIGVSEFMLSLVFYLIARSEIHDARAAMHWLVGSVGQTGVSELRALIVALIVLVPVAFVLNRGLRALELGDEQAQALGARVETTRLGLIAVAVALVAVATAVAGPVAFVALVAGPLAQRLLGPGRLGILAAGFVGASIVLAADLISQQALPVALPTGVVTGAVGLPYLLWLLVRMNREGRAG